MRLGRGVEAHAAIYGEICAPLELYTTAFSDTWSYVVHMPYFKLHIAFMHLIFSAEEKEHKNALAKYICHWEKLYGKLQVYDIRIISSLY